MAVRSPKRLWTPEEVREAVRLDKLGRSANEIGGLLGRSAASVDNALRRAHKERDRTFSQTGSFVERIVGIAPGMSDDEAKLAVRQIDEEPITAITSRLMDQAPPYKKLLDERPVIFCVGMSDLHIGQQGVSASGRITYDYTIAERRIAHYRDRVLEFFEDSRHRYNIVGIMAVRDGDDIEGQGVYEGQDRHILDDAPAQKRVAAAMQASFLATLHKRTGMPIAIVSAPGNHDVSGRDRASDASRDIHAQLIDALHGLQVPVVAYRGHSQVTMFEEPATKIRGLILHKMARNPMTPANISKIRSWRAERGIDWVFTGHWHEHATIEVGGATIIRSGAMPTQTAYAEQWGMYSRPSQSMWLQAEGCGAFDVRQAYIGGMEIEDDIHVLQWAPKGLEKPAEK